MSACLPSIHLNGSGRATLQSGYDLAAEKLRDFVEAWQAIEFNARDYYVQGADAWTAARDERAAMSKRIGEVSAYLDSIREHLYS